MKYCIIFFIFLLTAISAQAQEILLPLHSNPTQNIGNSNNEKGYRPNFSDFCRAPESIALGETILPTCLLGNGSLNISLQNIATPYNITYTGTGNGNSGALSDLNEQEFTLTGLKAGAYFITITDADGRVQQRYYELNNVDAEPTTATHWEIVPPFCNQLGKLKKRAFTPGAVGEFKLFDQNHTLIANYNGSTQISTALPQGIFYLQRQESSGCRSFYIFEVVPKPSIDIPFVDDFSTASVVPDERYWEGGCALINDSYAWQPFTMGVATFDGLNCEGQPYSPIPSGSDFIYGHADILTSHPACMASSSDSIAVRDTTILLGNTLVQLNGFITLNGNQIDISGTYYWINNELFPIDNISIAGNSFIPIFDTIYNASTILSMPNGDPFLPTDVVNLPQDNIIAPEDVFNLNGNAIQINGIMQPIDDAPAINGTVWDLPGTVFLSPASDAYLSFLYQPQGLGDYPNIGDSLVVEILTADEKWRKLWAVWSNGDSIITTQQDTITYTDNTHLPFRHVSLLISDTIAAAATIWDGFQFRFRNSATISGNNDHWQVDYVQLRPNKLNMPVGTQAFTNNDYKDSGFISNPPTMLNRYQAMPWKHFWGHTNTELKQQSDYQIGVINTNIVSDNRTLTYTLKEICSDAVLFETSGTGTEPNDIGNFTGKRQLDFFFKKPEIETALEQNADLFEDKDSVILENRVALDDANDDRLGNNDTAYFHQKFFNYFAYDDGVAEKAYGLYGVGSKLAVRFHLNEPDTLRAIQIAFVAQNQAIENLPFKLAVWKSVQLNSNNAQLLYQSSDNYIPQLIQHPNGLWTYMLEQPIVVSDSIYIGFIQAEADFLPVAFDVNNTYGYNADNEVNSEIVYNTSGYWYNSLYQGALLMRPVVGSAFNEAPINVGINPIVTSNNQITLYPNPTNNEFCVQGNNAHTIELYDFTGRLITQQLAQDAVSVANLPQGIYLAKVYDEQTKIVGIKKVIVQ